MSSTIIVCRAASRAVAGPQISQAFGCSRTVSTEYMARLRCSRPDVVRMPDLSRKQNMSSFSTRSDGFRREACLSIRTANLVATRSVSLSTRTPQCQSRQVSSTAVRGYKTVQEQRSRHRSGPFSWRAGILFLVSGASLILYFRYEKARLERLRIAEAAKGVGRPKVGGAFNLVDQNNVTFTEQNLRGKYALVYFGFSHCPDICPEELDKMASMIDLVEAKMPRSMRPVFITCDPARDTPAVIKEYLAEFHPSMIGLTGSWEEVKRVCKAYRVYFSTPPDVKPGQDYLVDHSIYFYLMDPEGDFVEAIGRQHSPQRAAEIILAHMGDWNKGFDRE